MWQRCGILIWGLHRWPHSYKPLHISLLVWRTLETLLLRIYAMQGAQYTRTWNMAKGSSPSTGPSATKHCMLLGKSSAPQSDNTPSFVAVNYFGILPSLPGWIDCPIVFPSGVMDEQRPWYISAIQEEQGVEVLLKHKAVDSEPSCKVCKERTVVGWKHHQPRT